MMHKNLYQILDLSHNASQSEIKKAFRFYASKFHPDKHNGDKFFEDKFREVKDAYDILSDPIKRDLYDAQFFNIPEEEAQSAKFSKSDEHDPNQSANERSDKETASTVIVRQRGNRFGCFLMLLPLISFFVLAFSGHDIGPVIGTSLWIIFFIGLLIFKNL